MCSRLFNRGMRYEVRGAELTPVPRPDRALAQRFSRAATQGGASHLRENAGTPESFARNYGRTFHAVVLENERLRATVVPELGGRLYSLHHKPTGLELMHMTELARKVNYLPYGSGYEFAVQPQWQAAGTSEEYDVLLQWPGRVLLQADVAGELRVRSAFGLKGDVLSITHCIQNRGRKAARIEPFTHPEWNQRAFGDEAIVRFRRGNAWRSMPLNPQRRPNRDLDFAAGQMPHGAWQMVSAVAPLIMEETFAPAAVSHTRLTFGGWGNLNMELYFKPRILRPRQQCTFQTKWRISLGQ